MVNQITDILGDVNLPWLLTNLRQDFIVWNALNDPPFLEKVIESKPSTAQDFAPGNLALLALDRPNLMASDALQSTDTFDEPVVQLAIKSLSERASLGPAAQELAAAGLVALTWLNKFITENSWEGLLEAIHENPKKDWPAIIACLFSLCKSPNNFVKSLFQGRESALLVGLAIHAILCNPLTNEEQVDSIFTLCCESGADPLKISDRILLIDALSEQSPQAAVKLATRWLDTHPGPPENELKATKNLVVLIDQLLENVFWEKVRHLSNPLQRSSRLLETQLGVIQGIYFDLISQNLRYYLDKPLGSSKSNHAAEIVDRVIQHMTLNLPGEISQESEFGLALVLVDRGCVDEAKSLIAKIESSGTDCIEELFAKSKISLIDGDLLAAKMSASKILEQLRQPSRGEKIMVWGDGLSLTNLGHLFVELQMPTDAAWVYEAALNICPNDTSLLKLFAESCISARLYQKAADILQIMIALQPNELDIQRAYAQSLEYLGEWQTSLDQRQAIIISCEDQALLCTLSDKYAYANCAIKAYKPEIAIEVSKKILAEDPADTWALIYLGQANMIHGEKEEGLRYLVQATHVAPEMEETWIELVQAQLGSDSHTAVIQTLESAIQAIPSSSQLHYVLGDLYLQDNQPDLALAELRSSAELLPDNAKALVKYGQALQLLGQIDLCYEVYRKAYQIEPEFSGLAQAYANLLLNRGALEEAIAPLETFISSKSIHDVAPYMNYARTIMILNKQGSTQNSPMKALIALNEVLQIDPDNSEAKALTAEALTANGEYELAFQAYREALDTSLTEDEAWFERLSYGLGCVASAIGKQDIAIAALQEASRVNPNNSAIFMALSDAYLYAHLGQDAFEAASTVIDIDGEDPDKLAWFANQVAKLYDVGINETLNSVVGTSKNIINEALSALAKAINLAPRRSDLLVQMGSFQARIGKVIDAQATFASLSGLGFASVGDLVSAAKFLSESGDHQSAIACLEEAVSLDRSSSCHDPSLVATLANEYFKNHDPSSAIITIDHAFELIPNDSNLISLKVQILLSIKQPLDALEVINLALHKNLELPTRLELLFLASRIDRCMGDFQASVKHASMGVSLSSKKNSSQSNIQLSNHLLSCLADIYRILSQPLRAFDILQQTQDCHRSNFADEQDYLEYIFQHTELALELGERILPDIQDVKLEAPHPFFSRWMALNSRLMNRAGNYRQAEQLLQIAVSNFPNYSQLSEVTGWSAPLVMHSNLVAISEAAQDLGLWDSAIDYAHQAVEFAPDEPLHQVNIVKCLVLRAEFNELCERFDVIRHKPAITTPAEETYSLCQQYLEQARKQLDLCSELFIDEQAGNTDEQICKWQARAEIIFEQGDDTKTSPEEVLAQHGTAGDIVASIRYLHRHMNSNVDEDNLTRIIQLARLYPRNPAVILRVALALQDDNPKDALKSLQAMLEHNPYAKNPAIAFCNVLLSKIAQSLNELCLAQQAIENAISFWPDEDRWHYHAAQIYTCSNETNNAILHLQDAVQIDASNLTYQIDLGKLLLKNAENNIDVLGKALTCFENAIVLDPNNAAVHTQLAYTNYLLYRKDQAELYARNGLAIKPEQADLYRLLSKIALEKNDFQGGYEYALKAVQANPQNVQSIITVARALAAMGRNDEALEKLQEAIPSVEDARLLHLEMVDFIRRVSGPQVAINKLNVLTTLYPGDFAVLAALSKALFEVGELENALAIAEQALRSETEKVPANERTNVHLLIGQSLRRQGDLEKSIRYLNEAIKLSPNRLEPYLELGLARKERRDYQQALKIFEQASIIAPNDPRALFQAGLALKESKDYKSSETMLRKAMSLAPNDLAIRRQLAAVVALNLIHNPRSSRANEK